MADKKIISILKSDAYTQKGDTFFFLPDQRSGGFTKEETGTLRGVLKERLPSLYNKITYFMSAVFEQGLSDRTIMDVAFPKKDFSDRTIVNVGSGTKDLGHGIINLDAYPFPNVHVVASAEQLPFKNESVDMIISISLLEHVPCPEVAIAEMSRTVKRGGYVFIAVPFLYPFHSSPSDFSRFTVEGLTARFKGFEVVRAGVDGGPCTALVIQLSYFFALILSFGISRLYGFLINVFLVLSAPLRALDFFFAKLPNAKDTAASVYFFARKS